MADEETKDAAPVAVDSESAGTTQAKRRAVKKGATSRVEAATKTSDAGVAGREGEVNLAPLPEAQVSPVSGSNRSSVAPIDPITAAPEIMQGKVKSENPDATPAAVLHPNYEPTRYVDSNGDEITDADGLFEEVGATKVRVTGRVSEIVPARNADVPHRRLLFSMGTEVDKSVAEAFKAALRK